MSGRTQSHTHRDTLAFVLTILGASLWAMAPAAVLMKEQGWGTQVGLPIICAAGALLGAWSGTTVWRHVAWAIPAVAAGLVAAVVVAVQQKAVCGTFAIDTRWLASVAGATAGGAGGAWIARHARGPRRALVAAWIAISGPALLLLALGVLDALGVDTGGGGIAWIVMLSLVPASAVATRLCGGVRPGAFAAIVFALLVSAFLVGKTSNDGSEVLTSVVASVLMAALLTWLASIPVRRFHMRHPAPTDLPAAHVVDR